MKAVVITEFGGPEVLMVQERERPTIGPEEVLIAVKAAGINRPDHFQRKGNYPAPAGVVADIPGLEVAGIVEEVGSAVTRWKVGDQVCSLVAGGGYAAYVAVHAAMCLPIPVGLSFAEAAILPETIYTVWDNLFRRGQLVAGEGVLIHGGSGGIGSTAIQLAKAFGARVFTTVGDAVKGAYCEKLGADVVVPYKEQDFAAVLKEERVDVVLDSIGGSYFSKHIDMLAPDGRLIHVNAVGGVKVELHILKMMQKRLLLTGSTLRARDLSFKIELTQAVYDHVWSLIGQKFRPQLYKTFPLEDAAKAHELLESGDFLGKLALVV
ncbi:NAD(P)H-quinone oxidoreductase [Sphingobacterium psychroaquaticum]|uniref:Putative NAD(P)H quinone oxidoreductase, PIG3 family n=1 Tax=Sphingobacterium psychroaquaticum TaxID=561061 RepID=A0A1X7I433_9SPHI|nr:NAD(P)H-quinone oxidoreductase [Sphingobacterium psychroaquaticum]SMG08480.1 putative NAD(P)H quinone oxidoreductase, PIG3 family [Sphingobacterium psychroaquaticum]